MTGDGKWKRVTMSVPFLFCERVIVFSIYRVCEISKDYTSNFCRQTQDVSVCCLCALKFPSRMRVVERDDLRTHTANRKRRHHDIFDQMNKKEYVWDYDVLRLIFTFLEEDEIAVAARVSRQWRKISQDKFLWKSLYERDMNDGCVQFFSK